MSVKIIILLIFFLTYALAISRKVKLSYIAMAASFLVIAPGFLPWQEALFKAVDWDVLGIYWGFMMVSHVFMTSRVPDLISNRILLFAKVEKYAIILLCLMTAFLSAFMQNVGVVLMMAPVAIATARRLKSSLFPYLVAIAVSSNVVTTVTMVADPPAIILALRTGMRFMDFYWFHGKPGLGTISLAGVAAALLVLLFQFRGMNKKLDEPLEKIEVRWGPSILFVLGVFALALGPEWNVSIGLIGMITGFFALWMGRHEIKLMFTEFDWDSFIFVIGIFILIYAVREAGILSDMTQLIVKAGIVQPGLLLGLVTWISVLLSSFIDNVPYTILMIPVCRELAELVGISAWPLLYGMLVGTGIGGNITPVGATANVFACGILEKNGYQVNFKEYVKIGLPFSVAAVLTAHLLIHLIWLNH